MLAQSLLCCWWEHRTTVIYRMSETVLNTSALISPELVKTAGRAVLDALPGLEETRFADLVAVFGLSPGLVAEAPLDVHAASPIPSTLAAGNELPAWFRQLERSAVVRVPVAVSSGAFFDSTGGQPAPLVEGVARQAIEIAPGAPAGSVQVRERLAQTLVGNDVVAERAAPETAQGRAHVVEKPPLPPGEMKMAGALEPFVPPGSARAAEGLAPEPARRKPVRDETPDLRNRVDVSGVRKPSAQARFMASVPSAPSAPSAPSGSSASASSRSDGDRLGSVVNADNRTAGAIAALTAFSQTGEVVRQIPTPSVNVDANLPLHDPSFGERLSQHVVILVNEGVRSARLSVNPPELGPIEVRISVDKHEAVVHLASLHAGARDAIDAALPRLREMLEQSGLRLGEAGVFAELPQYARDAQTYAPSDQLDPATAVIEDHYAQEPGGGAPREAAGLIDAYV